MLQTLLNFSMSMPRIVFINSLMVEVQEKTALFCLHLNFKLVGDFYFFFSVLGHDDVSFLIRYKY